MKAKINLIFFSMLINIPHLFIKSYRWNYLLRQQKIFIKPIQTYLAYLSSLYIGYITPGRIGEFIKVVYLKSEKNITISKGFSSVLVDRLFDLYLLIVLGVIGLWYFNIFEKLSTAFIYLFFIILFSPLLIFNRILTKRIINLIFTISVLDKVKSKAQNSFKIFSESLNQLINPKLFISGFLTLIAYSMFFFQCYLIVISMNLPINFITITLFMAIANLISFIPISVSGLGTRDAALIFLFSLIGLKPELAVSYSLFVFIVFFITGGIMGAISWWMRPLKFKI